jgi:hypothetical protein
MAIEPWRSGLKGKFLVDPEGTLYTWRTDETGTPHHALAAEGVGVTSWLVDGVIERDGGWEVTARVPGTDHAAIIELALPQLRALGLDRLA